MPKVFSEHERGIIRSKLLKAGIKELEYKSYRSISIDDIVADVGIAKGTFYNFFSSKENYFYEILLVIKEKNRDSLKKLFCNGQPSRTQIIDCLYNRYTKTKTIYDYFSPSELKMIMRKITNDKLQDDSTEFAQVICKYIRKLDEKEAESIVGMCNVLGLASANRSIIETNSYEQAIYIFCVAMADFILGGR